MAEPGYTRTPYLVVHREQHARKDVYGSIDGAVLLQAQLLRGSDLAPTGEPTPLADTELLGADGLLLLATHRSRHQLLTGQLDPSITDELRPEERDAKLNLYNTDNPNQPPYDLDFLETYRAEQVARN